MATLSGHAVRVEIPQEHGGRESRRAAIWLAMHAMHNARVQLLATALSNPGRRGDPRRRRGANSERVDAGGQCRALGALDCGRC